jgi:hypothetical protein
MMDHRALRRPRNLPEYKALAEQMSPKLKETFLDACLASGISEDDCIHAVLAFQSELLSRGFECQSRTIKDLLDSFILRKQDLLGDDRLASQDSGSATLNAELQQFRELIEELRSQLQEPMVPSASAERGFRNVFLPMISAAVAEAVVNAAKSGVETKKATRLHRIVWSAISFVSGSAITALVLMHH